MLKFKRLKNKPTNKKNDKGPLVGIDVSSQHAILIELIPNKQRFTLKQLTHAKLAAGTFHDEELVKTDALTETIQSVRQMAGINYGNSVIAAPADSVVSKLCRIEQGLSESQQESLAWREARQAFSDSSNDLMVDHSLIDEHSETEANAQMLLVAGRKSHIMKRFDAFEKAELTPIVVDVDFLALQRSLTLIQNDLPGEWLHKPIAMAHINSRYILFIITAGDNLLFQHHEHHRSDALNDIAEAVFNQRVNDLNSEATHTELKKAALQVKRQWQYYQAQQPHQPIAGLVFSGTLSCLPESKQLLSDVLESDVVITNPAGKMVVASNIDSTVLQALSPSTQLACGLAMRKKRMKLRINLLPWRDKIRKQKRQNFLSYALLSVLLGAGCSGYLSWSSSQTLKKQSNEIAYLQQQTMQLTTDSQKIENIAKPALQTKQQLNDFRKIIQSRYVAVELLNTITAAIPTGVTLDSLSRKGNQLNLQGETKQVAQINLILRRLNQSGLLRNAKLKQIKSTGNTSNAFTINASIELPSTEEPSNAE